MNVGQLVYEALQLQRTLRCEHDWMPHDELGEQCGRCGVIATAAGKQYLAQLAARKCAVPRVEPDHARR